MYQIFVSENLYADKELIILNCNTYFADFVNRFAAVFAAIIP